MSLGLVFGHWSETSPHVESLLEAYAEAGCVKHWRSMRAADPLEARGALVWLLRRRGGMRAWRAAARLLLDRLEHVGGARASAAAERRATARTAAADNRREACWLFRSLRSLVMLTDSSVRSLACRAGKKSTSTWASQTE